jgi:6-phosphogluconolactonase
MLLLASCGAMSSGGGDAGAVADGSASVDDMDALAEMGTSDLASAGASGDMALTGTPYVYVSGYSTTIGRYLLDETTGALTAQGTTTATGSPSFLAVDPARRHLYAVDETNSKVEAFAIDGATGALTHLGTDAASGGSGPAHLTVDATGKWVLVANYGSGDVGILPIASDGSVAAGTSLHAGTNAHEVVIDAGLGAAWVPCLGSQYVAQYSWDAAMGKLTALAGGAATVMTPAGAGPRHLARHPTLKVAYLIEETDSMIAAYGVGADGALTLLQRMTSRASGATGTNTGAEVAVHPSGKWVYASNRGDDDVGVWSVGADGKLTAVAHTKTGGTTPRMFSLDATGKWLLVANQGSGDVRVFAVDPTAGTLTAVGTPVAATMASWVGVVRVP